MVRCESTKQLTTEMADFSGKPELPVLFHAGNAAIFQLKMDIRYTQCTASQSIT